MNAPTGRRQLFGTGAALLVLGTAPAGPNKAAELDARLLDLVAKLEAKQVSIDAVGDALGNNNKGWQAYSEELASFWPIADEIADTPARTSVGVQAKAKAVRLVWRSLEGDDEDTNHSARHVLGLIRDLLGEA